MQEHVRSNSRPDRGLGPFTNRQLTTIVCVAIVAAVLIPSAAFAAAGAFTSASNGTPAVTATNTASNGIGVRGTGNKFGVMSNGNLGVAAGKSLTCTGCVNGGALHASSVGVGALATAAKRIQPLASGESESGGWAIWNRDGGSGAMGITFVRPVPGTITMIDVRGPGPVTHCPAPGSADPGFGCMYESQFNTNATPLGMYLQGNSGPNVGLNLFGSAATAGATFYESGEYTVSAP